jgi:hypothetical protein
MHWKKQDLQKKCNEYKVWSIIVLWTSYGSIWKPRAQWSTFENHRPAPSMFCNKRVTKHQNKHDLFFYFSHGVRLSPLGTAATVWPIVPAPDDRWWVRSNRWNANWQGKQKYSEKTCSSAILSTTNPTWSDPASNPGRRGGKPATNRLSYGTANLMYNNKTMFCVLS